MKTTTGFSAILIVAIIIATGLAGTLGWFAWKSHSGSHIAQGVKGSITRRSGNCMPLTSANQCHIGPNTTPLTVVIKQSTSTTDKTQKRVVKEINNVTGDFEAELAPGTYNMYVLLDGTPYCNLFGGHPGEDCEFTVLPGLITPYSFEINGATD